jgi:hypothetical protein
VGLKRGGFEGEAVRRREKKKEGKGGRRQGRGWVWGGKEQKESVICEERHEFCIVQFGAV